MSLGFESFADALVWSNARAVVLVVLVVCALALSRTHAGGFRHAVWMTALAGCLLLPLMNAVVPSVPIPILPAAASDPVSMALPFGDAGDVATGQGGPLESGSPLENEPSWMTLPLITISRTVIAAYAFGAIAVLGWFILGVLSLSRLKRTMSPCACPELMKQKDELREQLGIRRRVDLLSCASTDSPFTWGTLRPRIVLPIAAETWSLECARNVLVHELHHVRRFDWLKLVLQNVVAALYWFNPLVWFAIRQCKFEAERACDDSVLRFGGRSSEYAEQLVDLMTSSGASRNAAVALGDGYFVRRIRAILSTTNEVETMSRLKTRIVTAATALSVVALAACQVTTGQVVGDEQPLPEQQPLIVAQNGAAPRPVIEAPSAVVEAPRPVVEAPPAVDAPVPVKAPRPVETAQPSGAPPSPEAAPAAGTPEPVKAPRPVTMSAPGNPAAPASAAQRQAEQQARLARAQAERASQQAALSEVREQLVAQERTIKELQAELERQAEQLVAKDRTLAELEAALEANAQANGEAAAAAEAEAAADIAK